MDQNCKEVYRTKLSCQLTKLAKTYDNKIRVGDSCVEQLWENIVIIDNYLDVLCLIDLNNDNECLSKDDVVKIINFINSKLKNCNCC